jgi:hypothetical protein
LKNVEDHPGLPIGNIILGISAMTKIASLLTLLAAVLVCSLPAAPALAQRDRVFVASYGSDSNPCTFGSPCKTFQNAVNVVAAGGEVTAIDSAGFGTFTISHAVTITSPNGVEAGIAAPASGDAAITIDAGTNDIISLNGLTLDGDKVSGTYGIRFSAGGGLQIQNCVIRNFAVGINVEGDTSYTVAVSNTLVSHNTFGGIDINPTETANATAVLDHVEANDNGNGGIEVGADASGTVQVTVSDSVSANNQIGILAQGGGGTGTANVTVRNSTIANNTGDGLSASNAGVTIVVTRSAITGNGTGWSATGGGIVTTFSDNNIVGNGSVNTAPTSTTTYE